MLGDTPMMRETVARLAALRILDAGVRLGARAALVICNDPDEARLVDRFAAVCAAAGERGLRACLEFMIFSSVRTLADVLRIVQRTAHPAGAILVDALHLQRSGGTPAEVAATPSRLLPYAQLCDASLLPVRPPERVALTEARTGRLLPGDGELPLRSLVHALPEGAALAVESPVAGFAGRRAAEVADLAYASLTRLLARLGHV
jgi:sugar phosphate isomerase/epimerase